MGAGDVEKLVQQVESLAQRVGELERRLDGLVARADAPATPPSSMHATAPLTGAQATDQAPVPQESWEHRIGGLWLNRIGVVALIAALAFFLKYAFDQDWVNDYGRIAVGLVSGALLMAGGEYYRRLGPMPWFATGLSLAGLSAFYVTTFSAFRFYGMMGPPAAQILLLVVTAAALALSVHRKVAAFAVLGAIGGYLVPVIILGSGTYVALCTYLMVFSPVVLTVSLAMRWHGLALLGLVFTFALYGLGQNFSPPAGLATDLLFLSGFNLLFVAVGPAAWLVRREPAGGWLITASALSTLLYVGLAASMLHPLHRDALLLILAGWGALALGLMAVSYLGNPDLRQAGWMLVLAYTYVTFAVGLGLDGRWVTVAWLVQSLTAVVLGMWRGTPLVRWLGIGLLLITAGKLLFVDLSGLETGWRILVFLAAGVVFLLASYLYQRFRPKEEKAA